MNIYCEETKRSEGYSESMDFRHSFFRLLPLGVSYKFNNKRKKYIYIFFYTTNFRCVKSYANLQQFSCYMLI